MGDGLWSATWITEHATSLWRTISVNRRETTNGPAEAPAYTEQLRVMRKLGARKADIEAVERGLSAAELATNRY